ncbi:MAG TPA: hypothetical protein ACFCUD_04175 [Cyclobacteriaceae bacterium]
MKLFNTITILVISLVSLSCGDAGITFNLAKLVEYPISVNANQINDNEFNGSVSTDLATSEFSDVLDEMQDFKFNFLAYQITDIENTINPAVITSTTIEIDGSVLWSYDQNIQVVNTQDVIIFDEALDFALDGFNFNTLSQWIQDVENGKDPTINLSLTFEGEPEDFTFIVLTDTQALVDRNLN